jgi:hypothetical protein
VRTHKRPALCATIERALLERDRREIKSVERLMRALHIDANENSPPRRTPRTLRKIK